VEKEEGIFHSIRKRGGETYGGHDKNSEISTPPPLGTSNGRDREAFVRGKGPAHPQYKREGGK